MRWSELMDWCRDNGFEGAELPEALEWLADCAADSGSTDGALFTRDFTTRSHGATPVDASPAAPLRDQGRLEDLGLIGRGGMGEVRRVRDPALRRTMAMKVIRAPHHRRQLALARFLEEAQVTAQLQHPGILPVHELGTLPDGRPFFTMKEVHGRTLEAVCDSVHAASTDKWGTDAKGWTFRRLIRAFHRVCEAVAYAHARGVIHRDLKPVNIMVDDFGEVIVLDWGLARVQGGDPDSPDHAPVQTERSHTGLQQTADGTVAGTPAYMSPEQARGEIQRIDARTDVYALGAILYQLLSGRPPYRGSTPQDVLHKVITGPPDPIEHQPADSLLFSWEGTDADQATGAPRPPEALAAACWQALARDPADRFPDASALALAIARWLDGAERRDRGLAIIQQAEALAPRAAGLRHQAQELLDQAQTILDRVQLWQPAANRQPAWTLQDRAAALQRQASLVQLEQEQLLAASLTHAPDLPEAHAALADRYRVEHQEAEADGRDPVRAEALLRHHARRLPSSHADRRRHLGYLEGRASLTLITEPPKARVRLTRYELQGRRLEPLAGAELGSTPVQAHPLPHGSYLVELRRADGRGPVVRYPVSVGRGHHWDGVPPGSSHPQPIWLPDDGQLSANECHVPAGWFQAGSRRTAFGVQPPLRVWVDGVACRRHPVTNRDFIAFLDDLVARDREDQALRHAPRERGGTLGSVGELIYAYDGRHFAVQTDADGDTWDPDWPVVMVDWWAAQAYAAWASARDNLPWRLPTELEWEKCARGVDGRSYPWGDFHDPSWACMSQSHRGRPTLARVQDYPADISPYGIRGLAGNVRDWCADELEHAYTATELGRMPPAVLTGDGSAIRTARGGAWNLGAQGSLAARRDRYGAEYRGANVGFRLIRSVP